MASACSIQLIPTFVILSFVLLLLILDSQFPLSSRNNTNHGRPSPPAVIEKVGVGIDLSGFYGTVAASFPNGTVINIGRVEGSSRYEELFRRLSLRSSTHLSPPYLHLHERIRDLPRVILRSLRKRIGLPASADVRVLATLIWELQLQAEHVLAVPLATLPIVISTPDLIALYEEDVHDAFEYLGLPFPQGTRQRRSWAWVRDTSAALVAYGRFVCSDYSDYEACASELASMPMGTTGLSILYTEDAIKIIPTWIWSAHSVYGHRYDYADDDGWILGHRNRDEDGYWDQLAEELMFWRFYGPWPCFLVIFGESAADATFRSVVEKFATETFGKVPSILAGGGEYAVARGAAEVARISVFGIHPVMTPLNI